MKRDTQQRDAIRTAFAGEHRPLSVDEIFSLAKRKVSRLGVATVYRNLKALQRAGEIVPVELPGMASRWEVTPKAHHHHFLCQACERVFEVAGCPAGLGQMLPDGCVLEKHDILLRGKCGACVGAARQKAKSN